MATRGHYINVADIEDGEVGPDEDGDEVQDGDLGPLNYLEQAPYDGRAGMILRSIQLGI